MFPGLYFFPQEEVIIVTPARTWLSIEIYRTYSQPKKLVFQTELFDPWFTTVFLIFLSWITSILKYILGASLLKPFLILQRILIRKFISYWSILSKMF
jgi:hypothetical protein